MVLRTYCRSRLFTSGTLGRYSAMLNDLQQNEAQRAATPSAHTAAD